MAQEQRGYGTRMHGQLDKFFKDVDFPAHKDELIQAARDNNADDFILESLHRLPDEEFGDINEVQRFLSTGGEQIQPGV